MFGYVQICDAVCSIRRRNAVSEWGEPFRIVETTSACIRLGRGLPYITYTPTNAVIIVQQSIISGYLLELYTVIQ